MKKLGLAGFESVHAGLVRSHVRFEGTDALIELREWEPHEGPHFFELISNLSAVLLEFMPNGGMAFGNLADIAAK